jgi:AAA family ATP:ADP antiporter
MVAGQMVWHYSMNAGGGDYGVTLRYLMTIVTLVSLLILAIYWYLQRVATTSEGSTTKKVKPKISFKESMAVLTRSPSLGFIALMVIGYSISVNMVEVTWKAVLKTQYPHPNDYQAMMGAVTGGVGALSFVLALFVSGNTLRVYGWRFTALATPCVLAVCSVLFYLCYAGHVYLPSDFLLFGFSPLLLLVGIGAVHNVACKAMKYCLFDPTREMGYLSLEEEVKVKGKAAVDVVGARLGKSGSSWVQAGLLELVGTGSILSITHFLAPCVLLALGFWIYSVRSLARSVEPQQEKKIAQAL